MLMLQNTMKVLLKHYFAYVDCFLLTCVFYIFFHSQKRKQRTLYGHISFQFYTLPCWSLVKLCCILNYNIKVWVNQGKLKFSIIYFVHVTSVNNKCYFSVFLITCVYVCDCFFCTASCPCVNVHMCFYLCLHCVTWRTKYPFDQFNCRCFLYLTTY